MPSVLITGANRGLGFEFVSQYERDGWRVLACCRRPEAAAELNALARSSGAGVSVHSLDVGDAGSIRSLADELGDDPIDLLINNAGIMGPREETFGDIDYDLWPDIVSINIAGPLRMAEAFVDNVAASKRRMIVAVSSRMGSIGTSSGGGHYPYRMSKSALNMVMQTVQHDVARRGITVLVLHPGWVRTDMGGPAADLSPTESVAGMRSVIEDVDRAPDTFLAYDGHAFSW